MNRATNGASAERTVASWQHKAGSHCQTVHQHHLESKKLGLQHVQADELYARRQGGRSWVAMAMAVPTRLWLGGVVSPVRNMDLIQKLVNMVRLAWLPSAVVVLARFTVTPVVRALKSSVSVPALALSTTVTTWDAVAGWNW